MHGAVSSRLIYNEWNRIIHAVLLANSLDTNAAVKLSSEAMIDTNVKNMRLKLDREMQKQTMNWYEDGNSRKTCQIAFSYSVFLHSAHLQAFLPNWNSVSAR